MTNTIQDLLIRNKISMENYRKVNYAVYRELVKLSEPNKVIVNSPAITKVFINYCNRNNITIEYDDKEALRETVRWWIQLPYE